MYGGGGGGGGSWGADLPTHPGGSWADAPEEEDKPDRNKYIRGMRRRI